MKKLKDIGGDDNTIVVFTTDNGTEVFTWPDGGQTPFAQSKGTVLEGGSRVPAMIRWPGHVPAGKVENGIISGLDRFPTFLAAAGDPNIIEELKKGKELDVQLVVAIQMDLVGHDMITGKGPSNRHDVWYFGESELGAVRIDDYKYRFIDQRGGWLGDKTKPGLENVRVRMHLRADRKVVNGDLLFAQCDLGFRIGRQPTGRRPSWPSGGRHADRNSSHFSGSVLPNLIPCAKLFPLRKVCDILQEFQGKLCN